MRNMTTNKVKAMIKKSKMEDMDMGSTRTKMMSSAKGGNTIQVGESGVIQRAMSHSDVPGAGASKRAKLGPRSKIKTVMGEFKVGPLYSGRSKKKVSKRKQAIAIGLSEARKAGARIPKPKS